uniref:Splicing factor 3B subunit 1 n=1 Tax=Cacopsylla melanoneura TaxID=428564 RepID=A0A8D8TJV7_9HEMI
MSGIARTHEDIEAQIRDIQNRKKDVSEGINDKAEKRVGLGESGYFDSDIYDGGGKFEGYVRSIAVNDEADDDDYDYQTSLNQNKRSGYTAPAALLNDIAQSEKDYDPFADKRQKTIAEKEDEYRAMRRRMIISPERVDPFAEGRLFPNNLYYIVA